MNKLKETTIDDHEQGKNLGLDLLIRNKSLPSLEKKEHHYVEEFPNRSKIDP